MSNAQSVTSAVQTSEWLTSIHKIRGLAVRNTIGVARLFEVGEGEGDGGLVDTTFYCRGMSIYTTERHRRCRESASSAADIVRREQGSP